MITFNETLYILIVFCYFLKLHGEIDEVGDEALARLVDRCASLDLLVLLHLLADEVQQDTVLKHCNVEGRVLRLTQSNFKDFDDFIVKEIVERVLAEKIEEDGEEVFRASHNIPSVEDVLLQDKAQDLDDFDSSSAEFGPAPGSHCQFFTALLHEMLEQLLELVDDGLFLREHEWHAGEIGEENRRIVDGDVFLLADDITDDLSDGLEGEENVVELSDLVVALQIGSHLLDDLAHVRGQIAHDLA